jgi:hypothetical protein
MKSLPTEVKEMGNEDKEPSLIATLKVELLPEDVSALNNAVRTGKAKSWGEYIGQALVETLQKDGLL